MSKKNSCMLEVDKFVGNKIYSLRLAKGLSRKQLAEVIGVTHQQLQKYEKGTNKVSVGRLVLIAKALSEKLGYFYDGFDYEDTSETVTQHQRMCIEVSRNFMKIESSECQDAVNSLVKSLAKSA